MTTTKIKIKDPLTGQLLVIIPVSWEITPSKDGYSLYLSTWGCLGVLLKPYGFSSDPDHSWQVTGAASAAELLEVKDRWISTIEMVGVAHLNKVSN
jgi:hypothetical protein